MIPNTDACDTCDDMRAVSTLCRSFASLRTWCGFTMRRNTLWVCLGEGINQKKDLEGVFLYYKPTEQSKPSKPNKLNKPTNYET